MNFDGTNSFSLHLMGRAIAYGQYGSFSLTDPCKFALLPRREAVWEKVANGRMRALCMTR